MENVPAQTPDPDGAYASASTDELADAITQLHGLIGAAQSQLFRLIRVYDQREAWREDGATSMTTWLTGRLRVDPRTAHRWVRTAETLAELPATTDAYETGRLSEDQLRAVLRFATPDTDVEVAAEASGFSPAQLHAIAREHRPVTDEETRAAWRRRSLSVRWRDDVGMNRVAGWLTDEQGATVRKALEREITRSVQPNPETGLYDPYDTQMADALVEVAKTRLAQDTDADRATVVFHTDDTFLVGGDGTAHLEDGPVVALSTMRRVLCDSRLQLIAHAEDGRSIGVGRMQRVVPRWQRRLLKKRDGCCRFPGCDRAHLIDAHHLIEWIEGGPTDLDNLCMLCWYHHWLVHEGGWRILGQPNGALTFVRPDGRPLAEKSYPLRPEVRERVLGPRTSRPPTQPSNHPTTGSNAARLNDSGPRRGHRPTHGRNHRAHRKRGNAVDDTS